MNILLLHKQLLFPRNTGGKIRVLNLLRHFPKWHNVTCLCNIRPGEEAALAEMRQLGVTVEAVPMNESRRGTARFYLGLLRRYGDAAFDSLQPVFVNGQLGLYTSGWQGADARTSSPARVAGFTVRDGLVLATYDVANPEKHTGVRL
jgi:hypothetical protein